MIFWMVAVSRVLSSVADERVSSMRARGVVAIYGRIWAMEGGVLRTYLWEATSRRYLDIVSVVRRDCSAM